MAANAPGIYEPANRMRKKGVSPKPYTREKDWSIGSTMNSKGRVSEDQHSSSSDAETRGDLGLNMREDM